MFSKDGAGACKSDLYGWMPDVTLSMRGSHTLWLVVVTGVDRERILSQVCGPLSYLALEAKVRSQCECSVDFISCQTSLV